MQIEFLWFDDCPNHAAARQLLKQILDERGLTPPIDDVEVADERIAERVKFPGSPTIRINGTDIDPGYVDDGDFTLRCRVYNTRDGLRGVPERAWIADAIDSASG